MANVKTVSKYVQTGTKDIKDVHGMAVTMAKRLSTPRLVWILLARHKVALLVTGNIVLVLNWVFPPWTSLLIGLFR